jgi:putative acetyltransferase
MKFSLVEMTTAHLPALVELWVASWQRTMPPIDFEARRAWFVEHLRALQDQGSEIVCAFDGEGAMAGFVIIDPASGALDQLAVAPAFWGFGAGAHLLDEAKRRSPGGIALEVNQDNAPAERFYERHGFVREAESVNARSGLKTWRYLWPGLRGGRPK